MDPVKKSGGNVHVIYRMNGKQKFVTEVGALHAHFALERKFHLTNAWVRWTQSLRNVKLRAENANVLSKTKVWWSCQKDGKHVWQESIEERYFYHASCPYCLFSNPLVKKIDQTKSLATLDSERAQLWHPTKNGALTPSHVLCLTQANVWWLCPENWSHEWEASVASQKISCPFCSNLKVLYPELAKEWHIMRNHPLKSSDVHVDLKKKVWWQCGKNTKHIWQASVRTRIRGNKCPECD